MSDTQLEALMNQWVNEGPPDALSLSLLKEEYLRQLGVSTCTTCPDWKNDMFMHFRNYLKSINKPIMSATNKYMLASTIGSLYVAGVGNLVNGGAATASTTPLTDQIAEDLLAADSGYGESIIVNPDYKAPEKKKEEGKDGK